MIDVAVDIHVHLGLVGPATSSDVIVSPSPTVRSPGSGLTRGETDTGGRILPGLRMWALLSRRALSEGDVLAKTSWSEI